MQKHLKKYYFAAEGKQIPFIFSMRKKHIQTFPSTGSAVGSIFCEDWLFGVLLSLGRKINNNHLYHMQTVASFNSLTYFCSVL